LSKFHAVIGMTPLIYCLSMGLSVALKTNKMLWILVKANWYIIFEYLKGYVTHNVYNVMWVIYMSRILASILLAYKL